MLLQIVVKNCTNNRYVSIKVCEADSFARQEPGRKLHVPDTSNVDRSVPKIDDYLHIAMHVNAYVSFIYIYICVLVLGVYLLLPA